MKITLHRIIPVLIIGLSFVAVGKSPIKKPPPKPIKEQPAVEAAPNFQSLGITVPYKLIYSQDFDGNEADVKSQFWFTNPNNWKVPAVRAQSWIEFTTNPTNYKYKVRSPFTIGLVRDVEVKDYVESASRDISGLRIGLAPELFPEGVEAEVRESVERGVEVEVREAQALLQKSRARVFDKAT